MGEKVCPVLSEQLSSSGVFPSSYVYCFRYFESIKQSIWTDLPYFRLSNWEYLSLIYMARLRNKFQHHEIIHSVICACAWNNLVHQPVVDSSRDKRSAHDKLSSMNCINQLFLHQHYVINESCLIQCECSCNNQS